MHEREHVPGPNLEGYQPSCLSDRWSTHSTPFTIWKRSTSPVHSRYRLDASSISSCSIMRQHQFHSLSRQAFKPQLMLTRVQEQSPGEGGRGTLQLWNELSRLSPADRADTGGSQLFCVGMAPCSSMQHESKRSKCRRQRGTRLLERHWRIQAPRTTWHLRHLAINVTLFDMQPCQ